VTIGADDSAEEALRAMAQEPPGDRLGELVEAISSGT
jgi:hypothetical protein